MDCCICSPMAAVYRLPRNAICAPCHEGAKAIIGFLNKDDEQQQQEGGHGSALKSMGSMMNPDSATKGMRDAWEQVKEMRGREEAAHERAAFLAQGLAMAWKEGVHTDIVVKPGTGPRIPAHKAILERRGEGRGGKKSGEALLVCDCRMPRRGKAKKPSCSYGRARESPYTLKPLPEGVPVPMCYCGDPCKVDVSEDDETYRQRYWMCSNFTWEPTEKQHRSMFCAARSEVFRHMLAADERCKAPAGDAISLPELSHEELALFLAFLYTGVLENHGGCDGNLLVVPPEERQLHALLVAADKYDVPLLRRACEARLAVAVDASNVLRTLEAAELSSSAALRERAIDTVVEHAEQVVFSPEFEGFAVRNAGLCVEITRALLLAKMKAVDR